MAEMKWEQMQLAPYVVDISGQSAETPVSISGTAAASAALVSGSQGGIYDVYPNIDCFVAVAADPTSVTTSNGYPVLAGNVVTFYVPSGNKIGVISSGASGSLIIHRSRALF